MTAHTLADALPASAAQAAVYPAGWRSVRLGEVCNVVMGQSPSSETYNADGMGWPFLQGKAEFTDHYPKPIQFTTSPLKIADEGAVLISVRAPVGDVNLADQRYVIGRGLAAFSLRDGDNDFLFYLLQREKARIAALGTGTTFQSINRATLEGFTIPLPPLAEQRAIARVLHAAQDAIAARRRQVTLERERKAALMQRLFTRGTRGEATKQTEIGEMPESWQVVKLGEISSITSGGTPDRNAPKYWGGDIPWVKTGEIDYGVINQTEECISAAGLANSSAKWVEAGTLLMAMYGQGITRGKVAILGIRATLNQACAAINLSDEALTLFVFYVLAHAYDSIRNLGHGANQKNLNSLLIKSIQIPLPPVVEWREIADILAACDAHIAALEREIALHDELFRALLEELMSGRLSALGLVEEVASAAVEDVAGAE